MADEKGLDLKKSQIINTDRMTKEEVQVAECLFCEIVSNIEKQYLPNIHLLRSAYKYALSLHKEHRRLNGEPYIMHDLAVAKILTEVGFESHLIASAILHDVISRCGVTIEELEHKFGSVVADTINAVTRVSETFAEENDMEKKDLQVLSDVKFLVETTKNNNRRAFYIKLADTIHNMRTIHVLPEDVRLKETKHVRNILIPLAKKIHVFKLVDILESLCLQVENPITYQTIRDGYQKLLYENRDTISGIKAFLETLVLTEKKSNYVDDLIFVERFEDSIFRHLTNQIFNMNDLSSYINKKNVPLYDINLVVSEAYDGSPQDIFMQYYPAICNSRFRLTIIGFGYTVGTEAFFYKLVDRYGNHYRMFVQKQLEHLRYSHGIMPDSLEDVREHNVYINEAEPDEPEHKQIQVYRKDGSKMLIDEGATVLDFAFALHRDIGICARHAYLNETKIPVDLDTRLKPGDRIHIISDRFQGNEEKNIPHATIRWFEYLHTRQATKALARWLEKNMDRAMPKIVVHDMNRIYSYEIDKGATALDLAFQLDADKALHVEHVYLNKRKSPMQLSRVLRNGESFRFTYNDESVPKFSWLDIVKTKYAREALIKYFEIIYQEIH